ncbi:hypothetical protein [Blastococcus sp. TF02A-26]|uniref:hypothetical protein n=1 Tax=Blastococcus sp. TF02A-26 TaxID=2250577 RepID=UPI000DE91B67|nr:hypothetical protein [Blastococcus sp. TF02A-26]RBY88450.1 hypothetical protein DQ240_06555 [Blastococcus sp. TF02A-26]
MTPGNDWLDQARRLVAGLGQTLAAGAAAPSEHPAGETGAEHAADCRWCPLCQAVAVLRGERPELTAALADALSSAAAALRTLAEPPAPAGTAPEAGPDETPSGPAVQHIEIA